MNVPPPQRLLEVPVMLAGCAGVERMVSVLTEPCPHADTPLTVTFPVTKPLGKPTVRDTVPCPESMLHPVGTVHT